MASLIVRLACGVALTAGCWSPAAADSGGAPATPGAHAGHGSFNTSGQAASQHDTGQPAPAGSGPGRPTFTTYTACQGDGACPDFTCPPGAHHAYAETGYAPGSAELGARPVCLGGAQVSTAAAVARAFRRIPVPTPALHIQPVKGRTLVNFKTNFYASGGAGFTRTVTLLGHHVTLRIHVATYDFHLGDGRHLTTAAAGAAYPDLTNNHVYLRRGVVHPSLTTTWAADYRVDGGGWQPVAGTVTKAGPTQRLEVTTARPVLVNPASRG